MPIAAERKVYGATIHKGASTFICADHGGQVTGWPYVVGGENKRTICAICFAAPRTAPMKVLGTVSLTNATDTGVTVEMEWSE